jgi:predicted nucleic acid-binding protein
VAEVWVANASPVICLAKTGHLELLQQLPGVLLLPQAVVDEIMAGPEFDPARQALSSGWGTRLPIAASGELLEWGLGPGETAVLALAQQRMPATVVLDDAAGRGCAKVFGIPVIGTLGVVLRAKKRGLITSAADVLRALQSAGLHLDERLIETALKKVGEI